MRRPKRPSATGRIIRWAGLLLFLGLTILLGLRGVGVADRRDSIEAFEQGVAPLSAGELSERLAAEISKSDEEKVAVDDVLESLQESKRLHDQGRQALADEGYVEALEQAVALEDLRRRLLNDDPRLIDLIITLAISRRSLDLATALVALPALEDTQLRTLRGAFGATSDDLGIADAMVFECQLLLMEMSRAEPETWSDRFYSWLNGPAEQASTIRFYHGLFETMLQPIPDVPGHLRQRAKPQRPAMGIIQDMLIPNLQQVAFDHRRHLTGRRLLRLALDLRRAAWRESSLSVIAEAAANDAVVGEAPEVQFGERSVEIDYRAAREHRQSQPPRPDTAPPAFPLQLTVPLLTPEPAESQEST